MKNSILFIIIFFFVGCSQNYVDTKQDKFLTKELNETLKEFGQFDIGLWNYIVIDSKEDICDELKLKFKDILSSVMCRPKLSDNKGMILSYLKVLFAMFLPPKDWQSKLNGNLSLMSMPLGSDSQFLLTLLRRDPFGFKNTLISKINELNLNNFVWKDGHLLHDETGRRVIPVKFSYKAKRISKTEALIQYLKSKKSYLVGRHFDFFINQQQIYKDIKSISIVSFILLLIALYYLIKYKKLKLLQLLIPSIIATLISAIITIVFFGSIHGITISLGFAIIGLGMDYGIHLSFAKNKHHIYTSNIFGLITTLCVFVCFSFSSVPLIKEMMFFSAFGIIISFCLSYFLFKDKNLEFNINLRTSKSRNHLFSALLVVLGFFAFNNFNYEFGMRRFNFVPKENINIQQWLYNQLGSKKLYYKTYNNNELAQAYLDYKSMAGMGIKGQNIFDYLQDFETVNKNAVKWKNFLNKNMKDSINKKIYNPFFENWTEYQKQKNLKDFILSQSFLTHLSSGKKIISLWFVDRQNDKVSKLTHFKSLENALSKSSLVLANELKLFIIITFFIILIILIIRYKNLYLSLACMIPFAFSIGLYGVINYYLASPVSFMSLMGLLLLYGISVDYGIFSTDHYLSKPKSHIELNSGLIMSWSSSFIGFFPLIFCKHNILFDLGLVVVVGLFGIFYSTFYVLPAFLKWTKHA